MHFKIFCSKCWPFFRPWRAKDLMCGSNEESMQIFGGIWSHLPSGYLHIDFEGWHNLTHWGRETHICVSELTIIGSDNGSSPGWRWAIIWTNAGILLTWPSGTIFSEMLIEFIHFPSRKCMWKCCLRKGGHLSRPQCVKAFFHHIPAIKYMVWYIPVATTYLVSSPESL